MQNYVNFILLFVLLLSGCSLISYRADDIPEIKGTEIHNIRYKNTLWQKLSFETHSMIGNTLYVSKSKWLKTSKIALQSLILHECVHARRQAKKSKLAWFLLYLTSSKFRFEEECLAYEKEIEFMINNNYDVQPFILWFAGTLSGETYLWMTDFHTALEWSVGTITKYRVRNNLQKNHF